ncbi:unnamed protein product [Jaminaea pallidilutea]
MHPALSALVLSLSVRPGLVVPHLVVPSINHLSWTEAYRLGVRSVVLDKDNCITAPLSDQLAPELSSSFAQCQQVFGKENVLIVSNSSGCRGELLGAQTLSRALGGVTVLVHDKRKPHRKVARQVVEYVQAETERRVAESGFASSSTSAEQSAPSLLQRWIGTSSKGKQKASSASPLGHVLVIGDRITTDTVLCHRVTDALRKSRRRFIGTDPSASSDSIGPQAISVLTTQLWAHEGAVNGAIRRAEAWIQDKYEGRGIQPGQWGWKSKTEDAGQLDVPPPSSTTNWQEVVLKDTSIRDMPAASRADLLDISAPTSRLPDPTPSLYLQSRVERLQILHPLVRKTLVGILGSRVTASTALFFRDAWLLILRGCQEGLKKPGLLSSAADVPRGSTARWQADQELRLETDRDFGSAPWKSRSSKQGSVVSAVPSSTRSYSTAPTRPPSTSPRRSVAPPEEAEEVDEEAIEKAKARYKRMGWIIPLGACILLPICFMIGTGFHQWRHLDDEREGGAGSAREGSEEGGMGKANQQTSSGTQQRETAAQAASQIPHQMSEAERQARMTELERRRYELEFALRQTDVKLHTLESKMGLVKEV